MQICTLFIFVDNIFLWVTVFADDSGVTYIHIRVGQDVKSDLIILYNYLYKGMNKRFLKFQIEV